MNQSLQALYANIVKRDRRSLAKAITIIENPCDPRRNELLEALYKHHGSSIRLGVSGIPGVGKSTFINVFGMHILQKNCSLGVLTVDPSSPISGGSILGDRTRMDQLSSEKNVFIRSSPGGEGQGGVARFTRELLLVFDAAGYDYVVVETIGVGQSEYEIASMVDAFMVLAMPGTGDEIQGIKKGIYELADVVVITKADGDFKLAAQISRSQHENMLNLNLSSHAYHKPALLVSSLEKQGFEELWTTLQQFLSFQQNSAQFLKRRESQLSQWFHHEIREQFWQLVQIHLKQNQQLQMTEQMVIEKKISPAMGANRSLHEFAKLLPREPGIISNS